MMRAFGKKLRPRFARGVSQVLAEPMAWNQPAVKVTTLPNGVRVATKETFTELSSVGVFLDAGVRSETKESMGATRLIEHLALSGNQLAEKVESMGATLSADAGREQTSYTINMFNKDLKQGVDILADIVTSPPVDNLAMEKEALLRSIEEADKPTHAVIDDRLHTCAFRDCSLGFSLIGPWDGVESLTTSDLQVYLQQHYTADKMVIAACGPHKHEEIVSAAAGAFGGVKTGLPVVGEEKPYFCGAELIYRNDEMGPTAYIAVGWEGVPWKSPDAVTFMLMASIIGSYKKNTGLVPGVISGNRTVNAVSNKMQVGCADEFKGFNLFYKDTGMWGFYIACDEVAVEHAIGELMFGTNLLSFAVTDEEVERAKRELKLSFANKIGNTTEACADLGKEMLAYGRSIPMAEMFLRIDAIDAEEVKRVAFKYLNDQEISTTALGPLHGMPQYYDLRRRTLMHRY